MFKPGDKVVRTGVSIAGLVTGEVYTVSRIADRWLDIEEDHTYHGTYPFRTSYFKLLEEEDTSKHHKHHDLIIAWAKGAVIQYWSTAFEKWCDSDYPMWQKDTKYRVKPQETRHKEEIDKIETEMRQLADRLNTLKEETQ